MVMKHSWGWGQASCSCIMWGHDEPMPAPCWVISCNLGQYARSRTVDPLIEILNVILRPFVLSKSAG